MVKLALKSSRYYAYVPTRWRPTVPRMPAMPFPDVKVFIIQTHTPVWCTKENLFDDSAEQKMENKTKISIRRQRDVANIAKAFGTQAKISNFSIILMRAKTLVIIFLFSTDKEHPSAPGTFYVPAPVSIQVGGNFTLWIIGIS